MRSESRLSIPWVCGACALFVCMLWGLDFIFIKLGYRYFEIDASETGDILMFAGVRFIVSGILMLLVLSFRAKKPQLIRRNNAGKVCVLALLQTVAQYVALYLGMARTSAVRTSILDSTLVFFSILFSRLIFRQEKMRANKLIGCAMGFIGIVVMNTGGEGLAGGTRAGDLLVLLAACSVALAHPLVKKFSEGESPVFLAGGQMLVGGILLTVVGAAMGGRLAAGDYRAWSALLILAGISAATGSLWSALLKYNPVSSVNIYFFTNPLFGVLFSALLLNETESILQVRSMIALILICAGILVIHFDRKKRGGPEQPLQAEA